MRDKVIVGKKFLNNDYDEGGSIHWYAERSSWKEDDKSHTRVSSYLNIRDCSSSIDLDFSYYPDGRGRRDLKKRLKKLDTLITELQKLRQALEDLNDE